MESIQTTELLGEGTFGKVGLAAATLRCTHVCCVRQPAEYRMDDAAGFVSTREQLAMASSSLCSG
jgi:hypothetical protein